MNDSPRFVGCVERSEDAPSPWRRATRLQGLGASSLRSTHPTNLGARLFFVALVICSAGCGGSPKPLVLFCAPAIRLPVEAAARAYEAEFHTPIQIQIGGSQTLLMTIQMSGQGDLFVPADDDYFVKARDKNLIIETFPLSELVPVLALRKDDPRSFTSLRELPADLTLSLADPDAAAIGRLTREALGPDGYKALSARAKVVKPMVTEVGTDVRLRAVDGGIVWDSTVRQMQELKAIHVAEFAGKKAFVSVGILSSTRDVDAARHFARYLAAPDQGLREFEKFGFTAAK